MFSYYQDDRLILIYKDGGAIRVDFLTDHTVTLLDCKLSFI
jgi:hypothetical protein